MTIEKVTYQEYKEKVTPKIFYNTAEFNNLNKDKVEEVHYLLFKDNKYRFALVVGEKEKTFLTPFSAPFASFLPIGKNFRLNKLYETVKVFDDFAKTKGIQKISFTLPPYIYIYIYIYIYTNSFLPGLQNILLYNGYKVKQQELNYSLKLDKINEEYIKNLTSKSRNMLTCAVKNKLTKIFECKTLEEKKLAYNVIAENHKWKGYPLRMTWEQVKNTIELVPHNFFILENENKAIASAIVFHTTEKIAQVIYWGNIPCNPDIKPMNYLAYYLYGFYRNMDFEYLDIGPSTENGVPNFGLCDFKQSIGCDASSKFVLEKII